MSDSERDYDSRQYNLIIRALDHYENGRIELGQLVSDLEALNSAMISPAASWLTEFERSWPTLEEVFADVAEGRRSEQWAHAQPSITKSVVRLRIVAQSQIPQDYGQDSSL